MSSLNQAFLRAYAKDSTPRRVVHEDSTPPAYDVADAIGSDDLLDAGSGVVARAPRSAVETPAADEADDFSPPADAIHDDSTFDAGPSGAYPAPAPAERPRIQADHPLYAPRHDAPLPTRPLFAARTSAPAAVHLPPPPPPSAPPPPRDPVASQGAGTVVRGPHAPATSASRVPAPHRPAAPGVRGAAFEANRERAPQANRQDVATERPARPNSEGAASDRRVDGRHESFAPHARPSAPPRDLAPAWEVDAFYWPRSCQIAFEGMREGFDSIGEQLVQVNAHGLRVLGVTSATAHEGRSTLAMCLARAAAEQGLRVVLLDADLENPQLAPVLGVDVRHDWTEVLSEALPIDEAAVASLADRLTLVPLLAGTAGRANLLRLPQFRRFANELADACDLVIVDLPPLDSKTLPVARPGQASPLDAVLLIRDVRQTTVEQLREARRRLDASGVPTVGVIENFT